VFHTAFFYLFFRSGPANLLSCRLPEMSALKQLPDSCFNLGKGCLNQGCSCNKDTIPARSDVCQLEPNRLSHQTPGPVAPDRAADAFAADKTKPADRSAIGDGCQDDQRVGPGIPLASHALKVKGPSEPVLSLHRWIGAEKRAANPIAGLEQAAMKRIG
jgi:hypothetical protein